MVEYGARSTRLWPIAKAPCVHNFKLVMGFLQVLMVLSVSVGLGHYTGTDAPAVEHSAASAAAARVLDVAHRLLNLERFDEASPLYREVLQHHASAMGPHDAAAAVNNLGLCFRKLGKESSADSDNGAAEAAPLFERAIATEEALPTAARNARHLASFMSNLASASEDLQDIPRAKEMCAASCTRLLGHTLTRFANAFAGTTVHWR